MANLHNERNRLPAHERAIVTDEELRIASQISDQDWIARMAALLPEGIVKTPSVSDSNER